MLKYYKERRRLEKSGLLFLFLILYQKKIYTIRGKQVILDSDVANLCHYKTKSLNLAVKRNIDRFPEEFCFRLTENEMKEMRSQNVIASKCISIYKSFRKN